MPQTFPPPPGNPQPENTVFGNLDWREEVAPEGTGTLQLKRDETNAVMPISIPYSQKPLLGRNILGYPVYGYLNGNSGPKALFRQLPAQHPEMPWLYATACTNGRGQKPTGWETSPYGVGPYANYDRFLLHVLFQSLPYQVQENEIAQKLPPIGIGELARYCVFNFQPGVEVIQRRAGLFHFTEPAGTRITFPQAMLIRSPKCTFTIDWIDVPHQLVFGLGAGLIGSINPNWLAALGKVNNAPWPLPAPFACFNSSEMLLTAIALTPHEAPVSPGTLGLGYLGVPRIWSVKFIFTVMSPPRDPTLGNQNINAGNLVPDPILNPNSYGHNILPMPGTIYYYAALAPLPPGTGVAITPVTPVYQNFDFSLLLQGF